MNKVVSKFANGEIGWCKFNYNEIPDPSGILSVIDNIQFNVRRVFYLHKCSQNLTRGMHAHEQLKQILFCVQGSVNLYLDDGVECDRITLRDNSQALYLDGRIWRSMDNFSPDCILIVLCDLEYHNDTVITEYTEAMKNLSRINAKL